MLWDVFISHAHEDKVDVARPLANLLTDQGLRVWIDEAELSIGDSLRQKIDEGLSKSKFGVVVLSESFFAKRWPQAELNALWSRETEANKVVLPVWHKINRDIVAAVSPLLADKLGVSTDDGLEPVAAAILKVAGGTREVTSQQLTNRYAADFEFEGGTLEVARSAIRTLAQPKSWPTLAPKRDMAASEVWMGTDSPELVSLLYRLYVPLAAFRQMSYALERSASTFTRYSQLRFALLEASFFALTNEALLATAGDSIEYTPRAPKWRLKRQQLPSRYWWQGISEERFDRARVFFVRRPTNGFPDLVDLDEFRESYLAAYSSSGRNQQDLGLLANALYGFSLRGRPIYWRLLTFWDRLYALYGQIEAGSEVPPLDAIRLFRGQEAKGFCVSVEPATDAFESPDRTWLATSRFFDRFILPRLESYGSTPKEQFDA